MVNGLYKTEIIYSMRLCASAIAVEIATLGRVRWWSTACLHEGLVYQTPGEVETAYSEPEENVTAVPDLGSKPRVIRLQIIPYTPRSNVGVERCNLLVVGEVLCVKDYGSE